MRDAAAKLELVEMLCLGSSEILCGWRQVCNEVDDPNRVFLPTRFKFCAARAKQVHVELLCHRQFQLFAEFQFLVITKAWQTKW